MDIDGFVVGLVTALLCLALFVGGFAVGSREVKNDCTETGVIIAEDQIYACIPAGRPSMGSPQRRSM